ncbi:MAG TPA: nucleotide exchange factor GrpE [bacterium]|nr:nucleotide exchange factor GrpE [bacterium]
MAGEKDRKKKIDEKVASEEGTGGSPSEEKLAGENETATAEDASFPLEKKLTELEKEKKELEDRLYRLAAEFDNYRKRMEKEKGNIYQEAMASFVAQLLPFDEIFERVLNQREQAEGQHCQSVHEGLQMLQKEMTRLLLSLGVTKIETVGRPFNPCLHEATATVETEQVPEQHIVEEERAGYRFKDRILRPALVKVAVKPASQQPCQDAKKNSS